MTDPSQTVPARSFKRSLKEINRALKQPAKLVRRTATIGYPISLFLGYWMLRAYCLSSGIPVPDPDASLIVCLALIALAYYFVMLWLAGGPLVLFGMVVMTPEFKGLRPTGSDWWPSIRDIAEFGWRWLLLFLPFLCSSLLGCSIWVFGTRISPELASNPFVFWIFSFFGITTIASGLAFALGLAVSWRTYVASTKKFVPTFGSSKNTSKAFVQTSIEVSLSAITLAIFAMGSTMFFVLGSPVLSGNASVMWIFFIYLLILIWIFFAMFLVAWEQYRWFVVSIATVIMSALLIQSPRLGALTLRMLGYGGGLPISFKARVVDVQIGGNPVERIDGCLVLWTGAEITVVRPAVRGIPLPRCHFNPRTSDEVRGQPVATSVNTFNRSDVLDVLSIGKWSCPGTAIRFAPDCHR